MKRFRLITVILITGISIFFLPLIGWAGDTGIIEGIVTDVQTKESISGVNIIIEGTTLGTLTHINGRYSISGVPTGRYKVIASRIGYKPMMNRVIVSMNEVSILNFELLETAIPIEGIIVTATKTEHSLGDVPVSAVLITKEEIEAENIKTVQDALMYLPAVKINKSCGSWGDKGKVEIQGLSANHTLILVDGQKWHGGHGEGVDLQSMPIEMIERIEVVKGPASSLYGSDAIGGVVNIITKFASEKPTISLSTALGSRKTQIHEAVGSFKKGKFGSFLSYTYRESDGVQPESDWYDEHILQVSFRYEFSPQAKLTLKSYYSTHKMKYELSDTTMQERIQERFALNSIYEWAPDELSKLNLRSSWFNYKHYTDNKSSDWDDNNYEIELNYSRLVFDKHTLTGGYHYQKEDIDDRGKDYKADQTLHGFFLQDEIDFSPFAFVLGTRIDNHDRWQTEVNPKASLLYKITEDLKLRGSVGKAFRGPALVKLYGSWRMGPYLVHPNPDLKPERSIGYQIGAEYRLAEKLLSKLSFFRNDVEDMISHRIVKVGPPLWDMYWENVGEAVTQGIELSLASQIIDNLTGKLGYTFLDTEDKKTKKKLTYKAKHKLDLGLDYEISRIALNINLIAEYIGKRYDSDYNKLKDYTIFNFALTKDIGKYVQVFVRVDNIFDKKNIEDEYDIDGTEFLGGMKIKF